MSPKLTKDRPLLWFRIDVCPHLLSRTMLDHDVTLVDFILNKIFLP
jgi:hypothetical protein